MRELHRGLRATFSKQSEGKKFCCLRKSRNAPSTVYKVGRKEPWAEGVQVETLVFPPVNVVRQGHPGGAKAGVMLVEGRRILSASTGYPRVKRECACGER